ncbi:MAG: efflux RND transporter permease subunit, partial [Faecousia sp.]
LLRKDRPIREGLLEKRLLPFYRKAIGWVLGHKAVVLIAAAALLVITAASSLSKGFTFMPKMDMPSVNVSVTMPEGVDMEQASFLADQVLERISQVEGIDTVGAMMSVGTTSIGGMSQESYDVTVYVNLADENGSGDAVGRQIVEACAGLDCTVTASSSMMDMSMLTGSGISMNIYADDMDMLQSAARKAAGVLESIQGVAEVSDGLEDAAPALHIAIDRNAAMENGLTVAQVYMEIAAGLTADSTVASLELDGISTDVIVEKPEGAVLNAQELRDYVFEVTDKEGNIKEVPLSDFAVVEETTSLASIKRLGQRRYLSVSAELEEGYNVTLLTSQAEAAMKDTDLGDGVTYTFTGENETIMESVRQLGLMLLLGVLLVYLVMVAQFQSLKSPFIVMFTIPLAFTGGFLALLLCGMEVSVISLIGFVMLTGIIVNNGIVLVDYINQLRLDGMERREAIIEAGVTRMRPILMTTTTTVLGLLDMAVRKSAGTALMKPIAVVCIGGLVYATLMTLFVVPCIYDLLNKKELRNVREED